MMFNKTRHYLSLGSHIIGCILVLVLVPPSFAQPGQLDPSFGYDGMIAFPTGSSGAEIAILPDKKMLIGLKDQLWRLNPNGQFDLSFGDNGKVRFNLGDSYLRNISLSADQKILLTGRISVDGTDDLLLMRLNSNGTFDETFGSQGKVTYRYKPGTYEEGKVVKEQPDGKILVGGSIGNADQYQPGFFPVLLLRFEADGSLDESFADNGLLLWDFDRSGSGIEDLELQEDGKIVMAGRTVTITPGELDVPLAAVMRCHPDGRIDTDFGINGVTKVDLEMPNDSVRAGSGLDEVFLAIALQSDQKIVALGRKFYITEQQFFPWIPNLVYDTYEPVLVRLNSDGSIDESFGGNGFVEGPVSFSPANLSMQIDPQDAVYMGHWANPPTNEMELEQTRDIAVTKYLPDGTPDPEFGNNGSVRIVRGDSEFPHGLALTEDHVFLTGYYSIFSPGDGGVLVVSLITAEGVLAVQDEIKHKYSIRAYPNPLQSEINLAIQLAESELVGIRLYSISGQLLLESTWGLLPPGIQQKAIPLDAKITAGSYLLEIQIGQDRYSQLVQKL